MRIGTEHTGLRTLLGLVFLTIASIANAQYEWRSIDGYGNSLLEPDRGAAHSEVLSLCRVGFEDGLSEPKQAALPNPRTISNNIFDQLSPKPSPKDLNDLWWAFGQFVDHDITLSENSHAEFMGIAIPAGDPVFDPAGTGQAMIPMMRSAGIPDSTGIRRYQNSITAFVDGSNIYGSDITRANFLRSFVGGKLKVTSSNLPPFNTLTGEYGAPIDVNAPGMERSSGAADRFLICGDVRANENSLLASFHTLWGREHNRLCDSLAVSFPGSADEDLYQHARMLVGAQLQQITFNEWLPEIGVHLNPYNSYDSEIDPGISNEFAAAGFRFGHTLVGTELRLLDDAGIELPSSPLSLSDVFFDPIAVIQQNGVEALLRGASQNRQQELDCGLVSDLRNMLFGAPGAGGMDLAALNINRGRDRGLPSFNEIRIDLGLQPYASFRALTLESSTSEKLKNLYQSIDDLDPWVGFLAERKVDGLGETLRLILSEQFQRLRDGDRLYFEGRDAGLNASEVYWVKNQTLSSVIERNAGGLKSTASFKVEQEVTSSNSVQSLQEVAINTAQGAVNVTGLNNYEPITVSVFNLLGQSLYFENQTSNSFGESKIGFGNLRVEPVVFVVRRQNGSLVTKQISWL